jgi:hypothetical protein
MRISDFGLESESPTFLILQSEIRNPQSPGPPATAGGSDKIAQLRERSGARENL